MTEIGLFPSPILGRLTGLGQLLVLGDYWGRAKEPQSSSPEHRSSFCSLLEGKQGPGTAPGAPWDGQ